MRPFFTTLPLFCRCILLGSALGIAAASPSLAEPLPPQETPPEIWTLDLAINWAVSHNIEILQAEEAAKRSEGTRLVNRSGTLPRVRLTADADSRSPNLIDLPDDLGAGIEPETRQATEGYGSGIEIRQGLFFGQRANLKRLQASKLNEAAAVASRDDVVQRIIAIVTQSYDAVLFAQENIAIRKESAATFERLLDVANRRYEAGDVPELEILRLKSELNRTQADVARAESQAQSAEERFKRILALDDLSIPLELAGSLDLDSSSIDFGTLVEQALDNRMDLRSAEMKWEAAKKELDAAKVAHLPQIEAVAGYDHRSSFFDVNRSVDGWRMALVASLDLFSGGRTKGTRMVREADANTAGLRYRNLRMQIQSSIREFQAQLRQHETILQSRRSALDFASEALEQVEAQYEAGAAGLEIVLDAQDALNQARFEMAQSILRHNATVAQLEYACAKARETYSHLFRAKLEK